MGSVTGVPVLDFIFVVIGVGFSFGMAVAAACLPVFLVVRLFDNSERK